MDRCRDALCSWTRRLGHALLAVLVTASVVVVLVASSTPASAVSSVLYVAEGGTDAGTCASTASPCATITYALTQAAPAATINVSGTIHDNIVIANSGVTITGVNAPACSPAVIDGSGAGRVVRMSFGVVNIDHLDIRNGLVSDSAGGGGIYVEDQATARLADVVVTGNVSARGGGGYREQGFVRDHPQHDHTGNTAQGDYGGGGVLVQKGTGQVTTSTISGNAAPDGGGIEIGLGYYWPANVTVSNSTLSGNTAWGTGGGIGVNATSTLVASNTTFAGNTAGYRDGAVGTSAGSATIVGSTLAGNSSIFGGGVSISGGNIKLLGTIVAANGSGDCNIGVGDGIWVNAYSLINDSVCGGGAGIGVVSGDSLLGALGDNGGPTQTMPLSVDSPRPT